MKFHKGDRVENTHLEQGTILRDQIAESMFTAVEVQMDNYKTPKEYRAGHLTITTSGCKVEL